jgi:hypothetical protein
LFILQRKNGRERKILKRRRESKETTIPSSLPLLHSTLNNRNRFFNFLPLVILLGEEGIETEEMEESTNRRRWREE